MADDQARRHHQAAKEALDQLDWCIDYLSSLGKTNIAKQLKKNRSDITQRLSGKSDAPANSGDTGGA
jgi:hypothetical protein